MEAGTVAAKQPDVIDLVGSDNERSDRDDKSVDGSSSTGRRRDKITRTSASASARSNHRPKTKKKRRDDRGETSVAIPIRIPVPVPLRAEVVDLVGEKDGPEPNEIREKGSDPSTTTRTGRKRPRTERAGNDANPSGTMGNNISNANAKTGIRGRSARDFRRNKSRARNVVCVDEEDDPNSSPAEREPPSLLPPVVVLNPGDAAAMTPGVVEAIHDAAAVAVAVAVAAGNPCCVSWTCLSRSAATPTTTPTPPVAQHIRQPDSWSCGYRNYQMMLSALIPRLLLQRTGRQQQQHHHHHHQQHFSHSLFSRIPLRLPPTPTELPTVPELQGSLERWWNDHDKDPDGAEHYGRSLRGKTGRNARIGALEVAHLCWYHGIDAAVLQFIRCAPSRNLLPYVVWSYFAGESPGTVSSSSSSSLPASSSSSEAAPFLARSLLSRAEALASNPHRAIGQQHAASSSPSSVTRLPLYLQWEGHSVTIVGIRVESKHHHDQHQYDHDQHDHDQRDHEHEPTFCLLVLDPMKDAAACRKSPTPTPTPLGSVAHDHQRRRRHPQPRQPLHASVRLAWNAIRHKDLQIVVCTDRSLGYAERQRVPEGRIATAAEPWVLRSS